MLSLAVLVASISVVSAHGWLKDITFDGTEYPAFDPRIDPIFKPKRIEWGYTATNVGMNARGSGPVASVDSPDIACRYNPLTPPAIYAKARAGSDIVFHWTDWFTNHKGPLFTVGLKND
jgi:cellulase